MECQGRFRAAPARNSRERHCPCAVCCVCIHRHSLVNFRFIVTLYFVTLRAKATTRRAFTALYTCAKIRTVADCQWTFITSGEYCCGSLAHGITKHLDHFGLVKYKGTQQQLQRSVEFGTMHTSATKYIPWSCPGKEFSFLKIVGQQPASATVISCIGR